MAYLFHDNFDGYADGALENNAYWSGDSEFVVQNSVKNSGLKSVKLPNAGDDLEFFITHTLDAITTGFFVAYVYLAGGSQTDCGIYLTESGGNRFQAILFNDGKIYVNSDPDPVVLQTFEKGRWYRIVIELDAVNHAGQCRFKIQNNGWSAWYDASFSYSVIDGIQFYGHAVDSDCYFDDVAVSLTEPLPEDEYSAYVWGLMAKSQIDDETIEEAIDRIVQEHDDDPTAHLETGQSLLSHKAEAIIDHVAESVVADKLSSSNNFLDIPVNAATDHTLVNYTTLNPGFLAEFVQSDPLTGDAFDYLVDLSIYDWGYSGGDVCVDVVLWPQGLSGTWLATFETNFSKIEIKHDYVRFGYYDGSWHYSDWVAHNNDLPNKFRIRYDSVGGILYFIRDGTVLFSIAYTFTLDGTTLSLYLRLNRGSASSATIFFGNIKVAFDSLVS